MVSRKLFFAAVVFCCAAGTAFGDAEEWRNTGFLDESPAIAEYLGYTLSDAFEAFGPPEEVFAHRGKKEWQDNVVFYYPDHLYLFWFENRVWQVRLDERYEDEIAGFSMGLPQEEVTASLGKPFFEDDESIMYILPDIGVPVRMRLFFKEEQLVDLYIFRGDF